MTFDPQRPNPPFLERHGPDSEKSQRSCTSTSHDRTSHEIRGIKVVKGRRKYFRGMLTVWLLPWFGGYQISRVLSRSASQRRSRGAARGSVHITHNVSRNQGRTVHATHRCAVGGRQESGRDILSCTALEVFVLKPTGICNCSALPLRGILTIRRIGRLVVYYPHAIALFSTKLFAGGIAHSFSGRRPRANLQLSCHTLARQNATQF